MSYKYENPLDRGYKQFTLIKKQHNELFKYRQIKWYDRYEYYYNEHCVLLHKFYNWEAVIITTILFPITLLLVGLANMKECFKDLKSLYNQKKSGSFITDSISSGTETYNKVIKIIST